MSIPIYLLRVCYLLFDVPLPKQRRWAFLHDRFPLAQTDITGNSRAPIFSFSPELHRVWHLPGGRCRHAARKWMARYIEINAPPAPPIPLPYPLPTLEHRVRIDVPSAARSSRLGYVVVWATHWFSPPAAPCPD